MSRTKAEVGELLRQRRLSLGLPQLGIAGVSDSLIRQLESGEAPTAGRGGRRQALMVALGWPVDALARLEAGEDPARLTAVSQSPAESDLRELLGVGGQLVSDELTDLKARLNLIEGRIDSILEMLGDEDEIQ